MLEHRAPRYPRKPPRNALRWAPSVGPGLALLGGTVPKQRHSFSIPLLLLAVLVVTSEGCGGASSEGATAVLERAVASAPPSGERQESAAPEVLCERPLPVYAEGAIAEHVCEAEARRRGLTVLDLADRWTPEVFSEDADLGAPGRQPYRSTYLSLADERLDELPRHARERYLELFGISPTFRVLRERGRDQLAVETCHQAVDDGALEELEVPLRAWRDAPRTRRAVRRLRALERSGREPREDSGQRLARERRLVAGVTAVQAHLACEGLLERHTAGVFDHRTVRGLRKWQQRNMLTARGALDESSRQHLVAGAGEASFVAVLRALRERVSDATGLIEDGSARGAWGTVLGHHLDPEAFRSLGGHEALEDGAPDLLSPATEAAAQALGWTSHEAFAAFVDERLSSGQGARLLVRLPELPAYHSAHMDLRVQIDRGDVRYERRRRSSGARRPSTTLLVRHEGRDIALVRWNTTIGGWKRESGPEGEGLRYKESPAGQRVWRDVVAAPAWLPPASTPDDELVRRGRVRRSIVGPGHRSAFGLVMMVHHRVEEGDEGEEPRFIDEGIRSHGSVSYDSILSGTSHGCHRLYNHLAVRLSSFLLRHRDHVRHGSMATRYRRSFEVEGGSQSLRVDERGYRYELTPPVDVEVSEGRVVGRRRRAYRSLWPLPGAGAGVTTS